MATGFFDIFGRARRHRAIWTDVARDVGGTHHLPSGWLRRQNERIDAVVDGISVVLDTYVVSTGQSTMVYTRVAAPIAHGPGPNLRVHRQGFLSSLGKAIGLQDIPLGDTVFDSTFIVKADSAAVARRLFTSSSMEQMLKHFTDARLSCAPGRIELVGGGRWAEPAKMRAGIALIAELAGRDLFGVAGLRAVADATFVQPPGARPRVDLDTGLRVTIGAEDREDQLVTTARAVQAVTHEPLVLDVVDGTPIDAERASKLPQAAHVSVREVGTGTLSIDATELVFRWRGVELDPAHLRAGADLLGAIASGTAGLYR